MSAQEVLLMEYTDRNTRQKESIRQRCRIRKSRNKAAGTAAFCLLLTITLLVTICFAAVSVSAAATDEIHDFTVTVDVNPDASLNMTYHIDWEVLDDSIGKLEWIDLGVPNSYHEDIIGLSDTIDSIKDNGSSLAIYLDRAYGEGETVGIDFSMKQDHIYQIDKWVAGESVYTFTPAWMSTA